MQSRLRARSRASALVILLVSLLGSLAVQTGTASAAQASTWRSQVPAYAANFRGDPYHWGSAGPNRFDCSGFTLYVFRHFGKSLVHSSAQQYSQTHHIAKNQKQPGDLLFFRNSSGRISHVAIYAGPSRQRATLNQPMMWHAPHSGDVVKLAPIYSSNYVVGRL